MDDSEFIVSLVERMWATLRLSTEQIFESYGNGYDCSEKRRTCFESENCGQVFKV